jgi:hypothetical protein
VSLVGNVTELRASTIRSVSRFGDRLGKWLTWAVHERLGGPLSSFRNELVRMRSLGVDEEEGIRQAAYFAGRRARRVLGDQWAEVFIPLFRSARSAGIPERDAIIEAGRWAAQWPRR